MHTAEMRAPPLGPDLVTVWHPVMGPVTHFAGDPVAATSSPRRDTLTDFSPLDLADEASDEIPRLTRLFRADATQHLNGITSLLGLLRADDPADESVLQYGPIARQPAPNDFAADMVVVQLQCTSLLARVEALEARQTHRTDTPHPRGKHRGRAYHEHIKQGSREKQKARDDKIERNI